MRILFVVIEENRSRERSGHDNQTTARPAVVEIKVPTTRGEPYGCAAPPEGPVGLRLSRFFRILRDDRERLAFDRFKRHFAAMSSSGTSRICARDRTHTYEEARNVEL
jgi:hypothetical protein